MYVSPGEHNKLALTEAIPVGTILECKEVYNYFTYTSYNGVNGWVVDLNMMTVDNAISKIARKSDNKNIITVKNATLYEFPDVNSKVLQTVPQNTKLDVDYEYAYEQYGYSGFFRVTYNDEIGWLNVEECGIEIDEEYVFNEEIEMSKDLIIDDNIVAGKGESIKLYSKYVATQYYGQYPLNNYYFEYNGYNFFLDDLHRYYPAEAMYIVFLNPYEDLPQNEKLKIKEYGKSLVSEWIKRYYIEYNEKSYELKLEDFVGIVFDESNEDQLVSMYEATSDFELVKSPYDNTVIAQVKKGDIMYSAGSLNVYGKRYGNSLVTQNGKIGFLPGEDSSLYKFIFSDTKEKIQNYIESSKNSKVKFVSNEEIKDYFEDLEYFVSGDYVTNKELIFYFDLFEENFQEKQIPENMDISMIGTAAIVPGEDGDKLYYYVSFDEQNGYVMLESGDIRLKEVVEGPIEKQENEVNIFEVQSEKNEKSSIVMGILCVGGAIILALTAFVTIKLINKKNNK